MNSHRKNMCFGLSLAFSVLAFTGPAIAQSPITIMVSNAPGGSSDVGIRAIANAIGDAGGPRIVIENRAGGGGVPAGVHVRDAAPNGQTLLLATYAIYVINPTLIPNYQLNPMVDFRPITTLFTFPLMLAVPAKLPVNSLKELIALGKQRPGGLTYGSAGIGTAPHLLAELFARNTGAKLVHVPYKGASQGVLDLIADRLDFMFISFPPSQVHLDSGKLRAISVASRTRLPQLPNTPSMGESGYPDVNSDFLWFGLSAPAKTPDTVIKSLHETFTRALRSKELIAKLDAAGINLVSSTPEEFTARIKSEIAIFTPIIKASGATAK